MKRIAIVHGPMVIGGAEKVLVNMLKYIDYDNYSVDLYLERPLKDDEEGFESNINSKVYIHYFNDYNPSLGKVFVSDTEYDCAISYQGLLLSHLSFLNYRVKAKHKVAWIHGNCLYENHSVEVRREFEIQYSMLDKIFCVSDGVRHIFYQAFPSLKDKAFVFYNLMDTEDILQKAAENIELPNDTINIVSVGRISPEKGYLFVPVVAHKLKKDGFKFKWFIVGDGVSRKKLEEEIKRQNVKDVVILVGFKRNPYPYIKNSSVLVLPSLTEGYCTVTIESLILGTPVVATPVCGVKEQIDNGKTGYIAEEISADAIYDSLKKVISRESNIHELQKNISSKSYDNVSELRKLYDICSEKEVCIETNIIDVPKVSVVIPVYNTDQYLLKSLDSVTHQTYKNIEIICVDDGSTDNSYKILVAYAEYDYRIKILTQENRGLFMARKEGVMNASGDYILCLDSDDWLDLDTCESLVVFSEKFDADVVQYGVYIENAEINMDLAIMLHKKLNVSEELIEGKESLYRSCYVDNTIPWNMATKFIKRSIAQKAYQLHEDISYTSLEDYITSFYLFALTNTWRRIDKRFYHYRLGSGSSTQANMTLEEFTKSLANIKAMDSLYRLSLQSNDFGTFEKKVVKENAIQYVYNNAINTALTKLGDFCPPEKWIKLLYEHSDKDAFLIAIASRISEQHHSLLGVSDILDTMRGLQNLNCDLQSKLDVLNRKNKKHLKGMKILIYFSILLFVAIIAMMIYVFI